MLPHLFPVTSRRPPGTKTNGSRNHIFCKFLLNSSSKKQERRRRRISSKRKFVLHLQLQVRGRIIIFCLLSTSWRRRRTRGGYSRSSSSTDCTYSSTSASSSNVFLCLVISCSCAPCALCEVIVLMYLSDLVIRHSFKWRACKISLILWSMQIEHYSSCVYIICVSRFTTKKIKGTIKFEITSRFD